MIDQTCLRRPAYTLLEVLLALTIGMLLLGALYVAMNVQLQNVQAGRDLVEQSTVARAVLNRVNSDVTRSLGAVDPVATVSLNGTTQWTSGTSGATATGASGAAAGGQAAAGGAAAGATGGAAAAGGAGATGGAGGAGGSSKSTNTPPANGAVTFNNGLQGDANSVTIYVSRSLRDQGVSSYIANGGNWQSGSQVLTDLRQVTYKLGDSSQPGLLRQETMLVIAQDLSGNNVISPTATDPSQTAPFQTIAEEVDSLEFRYYDSLSGWVQNWPEDATNYDGITPIGPPLAVEIKIHLKFKGLHRDENDEGRLYRQVVAIPAANAQMLQTPPVQAGTSGANTTNP